MREDSPATRAAVASPEHYYWSDGVKIPLTVNGVSSNWSDWYYVHLDYLMNI